MMFYRIVSALLGYPGASLREALPEIGGAVCADAGLSADERTVLARFVAALADRDPTEVEADYVRTFDMVPEHSLHLTHHLIGADKNRGPTLIDLTEFYRAYGFRIAERELPDYLPLMLEFVSQLEVEEGRLFLSRWGKVLRQLRANLADAGSLYTDLIGLVEARCLVRPAGDAEPAAAARTDPCQDAGDLDPPVNWAASPACPLAPSPSPTRGGGERDSLRDLKM